jgi:3-oxoacyl-[acyl-carrier-protein] synthase-3
MPDSLQFMETVKTIITGTGSYIPSFVKTNKDFTAHNFYTEDFTPIETDPLIISEKFQQITGISERRYASPGMDASDMAVIAARLALEDAGCDPETLDQIIVAHNFGNVTKHTIQSDAVPSLAARVKHSLKIHNPSCVAYDILFGCPGWLQGVIQADAFFKAGIAKKCLVIGTETLSRVLDFYDRDSMIFSDGAGACVLEASLDAAQQGRGILSTAVQSHSIDEVNYIYLGKSNYPDSDPRVRYIKMKGRKVYEYAVKYVPAAMKECLDKSGVDIKDLKKVFIHQANEKMDEGIIKAMYRLYNIDPPPGIMPMSIHNLGNSSVATIPTLYDMVRRKTMPDHSLQSGDAVLFASVGAGMNINAVTYRV